jgi:hypothetical protein
MYSLTIHFGPNAMVWSFLFKEKEKAEAARCHAIECGLLESPDNFMIEDDFGQQASFSARSVHGIMLEDLALVQEARIFRSLDNARGEIKAKQRAATDPIIRSAQQGPGVIAPNFGRN